MAELIISRNGETDQYSIVLSSGDDTIRCMVSVDAGLAGDTHSDDENRRAALSKAKALAKALDDAIEAD